MVKGAFCKKQKEENMFWEGNWVLYQKARRPCLNQPKTSRKLFDAASSGLPRLIQRGQKPLAHRVDWVFQGYMYQQLHVQTAAWNRWKRTIFSPLSTQSRLSSPPFSAKEGLLLLIQCHKQEISFSTPRRSHFRRENIYQIVTYRHGLWTRRSKYFSKSCEDFVVNEKNLTSLSLSFFNRCLSL
jgi:hypothetical protein